MTVFQPIAAKAVTLPQYFSQHGYHSLSKGKIFHKHPSWIGMDEGQWAFDEWEPNSGGDGINSADLPLNKLQAVLQAQQVMVVLEDLLILEHLEQEHQDKVTMAVAVAVIQILEEVVEVLAQ